jgi:hypothetical protein
MEAGYAHTQYESSLKSAFRGAVNQPPLLFSAFKIGQKEPLWFLPASSSWCEPSLAGGVAGAKFLLLHFPLITSSKH